LKRWKHLYSIFSSGTREIKFLSNGHMIDYDDKFAVEVLDAIKDALSTKFGSDVTEVVLFNFRRTTGLETDSIIRKPQIFENSLDEMFGAYSKLVKKFIIKEIENRFQIRREDNSTGRSTSIQAVIREAWRVRRQS